MYIMIMAAWELLLQPNIICTCDSRVWDEHPVSLHAVVLQTSSTPIW